MRLLVLSAHIVHELLGFDACGAAMRDVLAARARGETVQPLRMIMRPEGSPGFMAAMPSYRSGVTAGYGLKAICITPGNPASGLDAHQGVVLLSSSATGEPLALLNASAVTEIRTAAVSAVATQVLARPEADVLAVIGTGVQAGAHLRAIAAGRRLAEIRVASRNPAKAAAFAAAAKEFAAAELGADDAPSVIACDSAREAVTGAGIVVTATNSDVPVLRREWLTPGVHINAVGACLPHTRELDTATVRDAAVFADSRESVLAESGDYLLAAAEGAIGPDHIRAEIGDLLAGLSPAGSGRRNDTEITIFDSLGLAVEDLAAADVTYRAALDRDLGTWVDF